MAVGIKLGGPDRVSIRLLNEWPGGLCFSPQIKNHTRKLTQFLIEQFFENGAGLFGRQSSDRLQDLREAAGGSLDDLDDASIHVIALYYVQRVRNYVHIQSLIEAGIEKARVPPVDHLTPTTCLGHGGRIVDVSYAASCITWFKTLTHPQYGMGVFNKNYDFPPFNIHCTCRLAGIISGIDDNSNDRPAKVTRTKWDSLAHIHAIMSKYEDANHMSPVKFEEFLRLALEVADELVENGDPHSKLERLIGESLAARGRYEEALVHLQKAINIRPRVGCQKLLDKIKMKTSGSHFKLK